MGRVSGPLIDRIDIHVEVPPVPWRQLRGQAEGLSSQDMRAQVIAARTVQQERFAGGKSSTTTNASMTSQQVRRFCKLDSSGESLLKQAMSELGLSARAHDKILRIARTIADLETRENIAAHHLAEAIRTRGILAAAFWSRIREAA